MRAYTCVRKVFIILELCSGGDLAGLIKARGRLPERQTLVFLKQLGRALLYLHQLNIAHLDLKPSNILLTSSHVTHDSVPILRIADFGYGVLTSVANPAAVACCRLQCQKATLPSVPSPCLFWAHRLAFAQRSRAAGILWAQCCAMLYLFG